MTGGPFLDVSDVLTDADFVGSSGQITVVRQSETVGSNGDATFTTLSPAPTPLAAVTPAPGNKLNVLPPGTRTEGAISVITRFHLLQATSTNAADELVWRGRTYTVEHVADWTLFGAGFMEAICSLRDLSGPSS